MRCQRWGHRTVDEELTIRDAVHDRWPCRRVPTEPRHVDGDHRQTEHGGLEELFLVERAHVRADDRQVSLLRFDERVRDGDGRAVRARAQVGG